MRIALIFLVTLLVSCVLQPASPRIELANDGSFFELQTLYYLAFEKHTYVNLEELYQLERKTEIALKHKKIPKQHVLRVQKWHHKLRSYLSFLQTMRPLDSSGVIKTGIASLLLHRMRDASPDKIDLSRPNIDFYRKVLAGKVNVAAPSAAQLREFNKHFLTTGIAMTKQAMSKYQKLFAFEKSSFANLCLSRGYDDCHELQAYTNITTDNDAARREEIRAKVNATIRRLNKAINALNSLQRNEPENIKNLATYQKYEIILMNAAQQGILPIFFTDIFKERSGNIHLHDSKEASITKNKLLTAVTVATIIQAVAEVKLELLARWAELKKLQRRGHMSQKTAYRWIANSEVAVAQLLTQSPEHAPVVSYLLHKYQQEVDNDKIKKIIRGTLSTIGIGTLLIFTGSLIPMLSINAILSKAIVIGAAANIGWIVYNVSDSIVARSRHLMLERSLLSGTSQQVSDNLELLRKFEAARKSAILSGTIGLSMTAASYNHILKSLNSGSRPFLSNYIRDLFATRGKPQSDLDQLIDP